MDPGEGRQASEHERKQLGVCLIRKCPQASENSRGARRVRNGHVGGETGLQNPKAESSLRIQPADLSRHRTFRPELGVVVRFKTTAIIVITNSQIGAYCVLVLVL